jgi:hypothetical protein
MRLMILAASASKGLIVILDALRLHICFRLEATPCHPKSGSPDGGVGQQLEALTYHKTEEVDVSERPATAGFALHNPVPFWHRLSVGKETT